MNDSDNIPDHGEHGEPHVGERLRGEPAVPDAQHVGHGLHARRDNSLALSHYYYMLLFVI